MSAATVANNVPFLTTMSAARRRHKLIRIFFLISRLDQVKKKVGKECERKPNPAEAVKTSFLETRKN
jgi:hypothetical protein